MSKISEITVTVQLDAEQKPTRMEWSASDNPAGPAPKPVKGMLLSLFDEETKDTMKIDLWTKEMHVHEMDRFMYQSLRGLAQTYFKSTQNRELADQFQRFAFYFGQETGIIPKEK